MFIMHVLSHRMLKLTNTQFYWFYGSNNPTIPRDDLPIVLWLQGGPGAGGTGYGNCLVFFFCILIILVHIS